MPQTTLYDRAGKDIGSVELSDELFAAPVNAAVLHQVVTAQLAARRSGTQSTKTRAEVRGGGAKPWKQKGTGRARAGSTRSPNWTGGGVALGPKPRSYAQKTPKKMVRLALRSALSDRAADDKVKVVDFGWDAPKTAQAVAALAALHPDRGGGRRRVQRRAAAHDVGGDPAEVVASYVRTRESCEPEDIGLPQQGWLIELWDEHGAEVPIVDAGDFLRAPEAHLRWLCDWLAIPFTERMLSWPPGPRASDGVWAPHWYANVWSSTGFAPWRPRETPLSERAAAVAEACRPVYEALHARRVQI